MKSAFIAFALSALLVGTAAADDGDLWSGFYLGAAASHARGENDWQGIGDFRLDSRTLGGVFAGYNHRFGNAVLGAEMSGTFGDLPERDDSEYRYKSLQDARLRIGRASGAWMVYVAGGYSRARFDDEGVRFTMTGYNLGAGVEYAVSRNVRIGLDYTARRFDDETCPHGTKVDGRVDTASLRLAWLF